MDQTKAPKPALSLEDLMSPKMQIIQARYDNARIAVNQSYTLSAKLPSVKTVEELVSNARFLSLAIEHDLNKTIDILDQREHGKA